MKKLNFFEKEINKCSKCGLCQAVCPIYNLTKNDCTSPRGKILMLKDFLKGNKNPSKKLKEYMKMCINCSKCVEYCPSKINITEVAETFNKKYSSLSFNYVLKMPFLVKFWIFLIKEKFEKLRKYDFPKKEKILYIKEKKEKFLPQEIENSEYEIIENFEIPLKFAIEYPVLYNELLKNFAQQVVATNIKYIFVKNDLCKFQLINGLKKIRVKKNILFI